MPAKKAKRGRPPGKQFPYQEHVWLNDELLRQLNELATASHMTKSACMRQLIENAYWKLERAKTKEG